MHLLNKNENIVNAGYWIPFENRKKINSQREKPMCPSRKNYRKIPKISPGAYIFQRPFLRGLFLEGLINGGKFAFQNRLGLYLEGNLRLKIDWASLIVERKFMSVICRKFLLKLALRT